MTKFVFQHDSVRGMSYVRDYRRYLQRVHAYAYLVSGQHVPTTTKIKHIDKNHQSTNQAKVGDILLRHDDLLRQRHHMSDDRLMLLAKRYLEAMIHDPQPFTQKVFFQEYEYLLPHVSTMPHMSVLRQSMHADGSYVLETKKEYHAQFQAAEERKKELNATITTLAQDYLQNKPVAPSKNTDPVEIQAAHAVFRALMANPQDGLTDEKFTPFKECLEPLKNIFLKYSLPLSESANPSLATAAKRMKMENQSEIIKQEIQ